MKTEYLLYDPKEFNFVRVEPATTREELETLRAENTRMREVLKPFADCVEMVGNNTVVYRDHATAEHFKAAHNFLIKLKD